MLDECVALSHKVVDLLLWTSVDREDSSMGLVVLPWCCRSSSCRGCSAPDRSWWRICRLTWLGFVSLVVGCPVPPYLAFRIAYVWRSRNFQEEKCTYQTRVVLRLICCHPQFWIGTPIHSISVHNSEPIQVRNLEAKWWTVASGSLAWDWIYAAGIHMFASHHKHADPRSRSTYPTRIGRPWIPYCTTPRYLNHESYFFERAQSNSWIVNHLKIICNRILRTESHQLLQWVKCRPPAPP